MTDLSVFLSILTKAGIHHEVGPTAGIGGVVTRVAIIEQNRPWSLTVVFDAKGSFVSIGTWIPPGKEWLLTAEKVHLTSHPSSPKERPIPGKEVSRQAMAEYALVEHAPAGFQTEGFTFLETRCVDKCPHMYRIDPYHPGYTEIRAALDRGDRSAIFCYHKPSLLK